MSRHAYHSYVEIIFDIRRSLRYLLTIAICLIHIALMQYKSARWNSQDALSNTLSWMGVLVFVLLSLLVARNFDNLVSETEASMAKRVSAKYTTIVERVFLLDLYRCVRLSRMNRILRMTHS